MALRCISFNVVKSNILNSCRNYTVISASQIYCNCLPKQQLLKNYNSFLTNEHRKLYTEKSLAIVPFNAGREKRRKRCSEDELNELFKQLQQRHNKISSTPGKVTQQDLKKAVYLCSRDHLAVVHDMTQRYCEHTKKVQFGKFNIGAMLMKLHYTLDMPDLALEMVMRRSMRNLFCRGNAYQILLCLLYRHQRYADMLDLMDTIAASPVLSQRYPRTCVVLTMDAAFRLGSAESWERGLALFEAARCQGTMPRRLLLLASCLALKLGKPEVAISLLHDTQWPNYYTIRNIKVLAWCEMGELQKALSLLRPLVMENSSSPSDGALFVNTYNKLVEAVMESKDTSLQQQLTEVQGALTPLLEDTDLYEDVLQPIKYMK